MKKILCYYHKECPDGIFAAWCVYKSALFQKDDITYTPMEWHNPLAEDIEKYDWIMFVDMAPSISQLLELLKLKEKRIVILDHHQSTLDEFLRNDDSMSPMSKRLHSFSSETSLEKYFLDGKSESGTTLEIKIDMNHSGAGLAGIYCMLPSHIMHVIDLVEDRDLFRFKLERSKAMYYAMQNLLDLTHTNALDLFTRIDKYFFELPIGKQLDLGEAIQRFCEEKIKQYAQTFQLIELSGLSIPLINVHKDWGSDTCNYIVTTTEFTRAAYFLFNKGDIYLGFRSRSKEFSVKDLASKFGGGGHVCAAACHLTFETFTNLLQGKYK